MPQTGASGSPDASIVIVTRNRSGWLQRALAALQDQERPPLEILVVDHSSKDDTPEVAERFGARRITCPPSFGIGACRQAGLQAARGDVIAWCDDDCTPVPSWLGALVDRLAEDPEIGLVGGRIENVGFPGDRQYKGRTRSVGPNGVLAFARSDEEVEFFGNANFAVSRRAMDTIGGYDPFFNSSAEIDLQQTLRRFGYRIVYEPRALARHHFTGVDHKHGRFFWDGELMRLYRYLKHGRPRGFAGWLRFWRDEVGLLAKDLLRGVRTLGSGVKRAKPQRLRHGAVILFNAVSSRLATPWLAMRGRRHLDHLEKRNATHAEPRPVHAPGR